MFASETQTFLILISLASSNNLLFPDEITGCCRNPRTPWTHGWVSSWCFCLYRLCLRETIKKNKHLCQENPFEVKCRHDEIWTWRMCYPPIIHFYMFINFVFVFIKIKRWIFWLPIVRALAKMTPARMNTMIEALPKIVVNLLMKNWPQKPAKIDTDMRYNPAWFKYIWFLEFFC